MWDDALLHNLHITPLSWQTSLFGASGCGHLQQEDEPAPWGDKEPTAPRLSEPVLEPVITHCSLF